MYFIFGMELYFICLVKVAESILHCGHKKSNNSDV